MGFCIFLLYDNALLRFDLGPFVIMERSVILMPMIVADCPPFLEQIFLRGAVFQIVIKWNLETIGPTQISHKISGTTRTYVP